jgi:NADP-dependent 3-hydroxy acid dehydrogenase YdfG
MAHGTALVTGATGSLGRCLVAEMSGAGTLVHALGRNPDALSELAATTGCIPHPVDVRDTDALAAAVAGLEVDLLVNNAGTVAVGDLAGGPAADVDDQIAVNLTAALHVVRLLLPGMIERGSGEVVNIGSIAGIHEFPGHAAYHASKAGVHAMSRQLRLETLGTGVRVIEISPGRFRSDMLVHAFGITRGQVDREVYGDHEWLHPEDVAEAVLWAVSRPGRVTIDHLEIVPTIQVPAGMAYAHDHTIERTS